MAESKNIIRDQIFTCIEISKRSKVPFLFMSNPGYGKTTSINLYAKTYGYHLETLIGSHYSQDEILGFQANTGKASLTILNPEWYSRIMYAKQKGIPSILFLDELSTVSPNVQGALLQLCFERKIRGGKKLPDDCIVIAAANFKRNLPGYSDLIAPELNRFCIINLLPTNKDPFMNAKEILEEYTQDFKEVSDNLPSFRENYAFTQEDDKEFLNQAKQELLSIFENHKRSKNTSNCVIDFRNVTYDGMYDRVDGMDEVLNFISPRTISYYLRVIKTLCEMGVSKNDPVVMKIVQGLLGLGTNTFTTDDDAATVAQIKFFNSELKNMTASLLTSFSSRSNRILVQPKKDSPSLIFDDDSITSNIKKFITNHDTKRIYMSEELINLSKSIGLAFNITDKKGSSVALLKNKSQFRSDYESVKVFYDFLENRMDDGNDKALLLKAIQAIINEFEQTYEKSFAA